MRGGSEDQCIYPVDATGRANLVCDYDIGIVMKKLNTKAKMFFLIDTCYAQGIANLKYYVVTDKKNEYILKEENDHVDYSNTGDIVMLASALDNQLSYDMDSTFISKAGGVFTRSIVRTLESSNVSWLDLLEMTNEETKKYKQTPSLSFNRMMDLNKYFEL
jgi:hypothetical protein